MATRAWFSPAATAPLWLALTACLSATPNPSPGAAASDPPSESHDPARVDELAVLLQLVDRQHYEPWLAERMTGGDPPIRRALAIALGRIGDPRGIDPLERLVVDADPGVRRAAAFALGLLEDVAAAPMLLWVAADEDSRTGALAVDALARVGVPLDRVRGALVELDDSAEARRRLVPALFRFEDEARLDVAREALGATAPAMRRWAAYALAREPLPAARVDLRRLVEDADPSIRAWAARALGRVGEGEDLERLRPLLRDPEDGPVIEALHAGAALIERGAAAPPASWRGGLLRLFEDSRPGVRVTAIEAAASWLLDEELATALAARVERGTAWERGRALLALARGRDPRAGALAGRLASAEEAELRAAAASAAAVLGDRPLLLRLYGDPVISVRLAVVTGVLEAAGGRAPADRGDQEVWIERGLADTSWIVRAATLEWLAAHPVLPVATLLNAAAEPAPSALRLAAVAALEARTAAAGDERDAAAETLRTLARDGEFLVRRAAVEALTAMRLQAPAVGVVETGKELSTYRQIVTRTRERPTVEIVTSRGSIRLRLACPEAPLTCLNFLQLVEQRYFDGVRFHRVVPGFVVQGGDRSGTGWGDPGYAIRDELNRLPFRRGTVGMALSDPDTGGSQFFITLSRQPHLDGRYTAFAEVVEGMDVVDRLVEGDRMLAVRVREPSPPPPATFANARRSTR